MVAAKARAVIIPGWRLGMKGSRCALAVLAWVLWIRTQGPTVDGCSAVSGFATEQRLGNMKRFAKNTATFTGDNTTVTNLCLPDTGESAAQKLMAKKKISPAQ
jgi:hypothetical protein